MTSIDKINLLPFWLRVININFGIGMMILSGLAIFNQDFIIPIKFILLSIFLILLALILILNGIFLRFFSRSLMILNIISGSMIIALGSTTLILLSISIDISLILLVVGLIIHAVTRLKISFSKLSLPQKTIILEGLLGIIFILLSIIIILGTNWQPELILSITFLIAGFEKTFTGIQGFYVEND